MQDLSNEDLDYLKSLSESELSQFLEAVREENPQLAARVKRLVSGRRVSKQELCDIFGIAEQTVENWQRKGCPKPEKIGRRVYFDLFDICKWMAHQKVVHVGNSEADEIERDLKREKARKAAIERRKLEGELVEVASHRQQMELLLGLIRKGVQSFHQRFGNDAQAMLEEIVDAALQTVRDKFSDGSVNE